MIDIHCHILPGMDDGSQSLTESLSMLKACAAQGIRWIAATPHFYAWENGPEEFLRRRAAAAQRLQTVCRPGLPRLKLGCELYYFEGISRCEALDALRLEDTRLLLLEMPLTRWTKRMLREIWEIQNRQGIVVLLAHMERYLRWQEPEVWDALLDWGVLNQCNAEFFLRWSTRRRALRMLREGRIHLLGSDSHNMAKRPPRLGAALDVLDLRERELLNENGRLFCPGWEVVEP